MTRPNDYTEDFIGSKIISIVSKKITEAWPEIIIMTPKNRIISIRLSTCKTLSEGDYTEVDVQ